MGLMITMNKQNQSFIELKFQQKSLCQFRSYLYFLNDGAADSADSNF